uniref:Uncharacterized protein n=1 Tax=Pyrodinium bahamense TaxID=73915 RepID=A0A7R9ZZ95_9DINO
MYGRAPAQQQTRPAPYAPPQQPQQQQAESGFRDPMQQAALEQLLRTIAERAALMETKDIVALTAVFTAACAGAGGGGSGAPSGSSSSGGGVEYPATVPQGELVPQAVDPATFAGDTSLDPGLGLDGQVVGGTGGDTADLLQLLSSAEQQLQQQLLQSQPQAPAVPLPSLQEVVGTLKSVKVSARTNVKSIAGAISNILRASDTLAATAVGPDGVNHVMKALSITRCYTAAEGIDLTATVTEVEPEAGINSGRCYAFTVFKINVPPKAGGPLCAAGVGRTDPQPRFVRPPELQTELRVSGSGMAGPVAGAVAKALREDKEVVITSVGPASVAKSVEALALARSYVRANGLELCFYPGFETIIFQGTGPGAGEQRCSVRIHAWPETAAI